MTVDFTLEDVSGAVKGVVEPLLDGLRDELRGEFQAGISGLRDELRGEFQVGIGRLREEMHVEIRQVRTDLSRLEIAINDSFQELTDGMNTQFDDIRGELKGARRIVRQHSADIAELRAAQGI